MTNKKTTKRALVSSVTSLFLCCVMLIGTTFAWFTDSATSGVNVIHVGNLDVEVTHTNSVVVNPESVEGATNLFVDANGEAIMWEPGVMTWENLTVSNVGNLALKYTLSVNVDSKTENYVLGDDGNEYRLSDILQVAVVEDAEKYVTREDVLEDTELEWKSLDSLAETGILREDGNLLAKTGDADAAAEDSTSDTFGIIICWRPSANDNNWNVTSNKRVSDYVEGENNNYLHVDLGIKLFATQLNHEFDSFGSDYDIKAWEEAWLERNEGASSYEIANAQEMFAFASAVNSGKDFKGLTVVLTDDIDMQNAKWTPIGANGDAEPKFRGVFDGKEHTISNLNIDEPAAYEATGLFGALNGAVKNLIVDGAEVSGLSTGNADGNTVNGIAVIAGTTAYGATIDNVHVKNATVSGNRYVAGIVGYMDGTVTNSSVNNVELIATPDDLDSNGTYDNGDKVGGIVAYANSGAQDISENTATDVTITGYRDLGVIVGAANASVVKSNNARDSKITINPYEIPYGDKAKNAGEIIGRVLSGTVDTSNNSENIEIIDLDKKSIKSADELIAFAQEVNGGENYEGKTVVLDADIDLAKATMVLSDDTNAVWPIVGFAGIFDGQGHTIYNVTVNAEGPAALFVNLSGTVQNLTVDGANITGKGNVAVITDTTEFGAIIKNVHVKNATIIGNNSDSAVVGSGTVDASNSTDDNSQIFDLDVDTVIANVADLFAFANDVNVNGNNYSGKTVYMVADIDLQNKAWTPIGQTGGVGAKAQFRGTFDGMGHTISNLSISADNDKTYGTNQYYATGMFGFNEGSFTIKNLNIDKATVTGYHWTAVIVGYMSGGGEISGCTVTNAKVTCSCKVIDKTCGDKAGVIVGQVSAGTVTGNTVKDCTVAASRDGGQVAGAASKTQVYGNTIENVKVSQKYNFMCSLVAGLSTGINVKNEEIGRVL